MTSRKERGVRGGKKLTGDRLWGGAAERSPISDEGSSPPLSAASGPNGVIRRGLKRPFHAREKREKGRGSRGAACPTCPLRTLPPAGARGGELIQPPCVQTGSGGHALAGGQERISLVPDDHINPPISNDVDARQPPLGAGTKDDNPAVLPVMDPAATEGMKGARGVGRRGGHGGRGKKGGGREPLSSPPQPRQPWIHPPVTGGWEGRGEGRGVHARRGKNATGR